MRESIYTMHKIIETRPPSSKSSSDMCEQNMKNGGFQSLKACITISNEIYMEYGNQPWKTNQINKYG